MTIVASSENEPPQILVQFVPGLHWREVKYLAITMGNSLQLHKKLAMSA